MSLNLRSSNYSVWIFCGLSCIAAAFILTWFITTRIPACFDGSSPADFPNYYFGARRMIADRPVYADLSGEVWASLNWRYAVYPADPPFAITALSPLSSFNYQAAWWMLFGGSIVALITAVVVTAVEIGLSIPAALGAAAIAVCSHPFLFLLYRNHFESILVLLSVVGWRGLRRRKESLAGWMIGLAGALKLFPVAWLVIPLCIRSRRAFITGSMVAAGASLIGIWAVGVDSSLYFIQKIVPKSVEWYGTIGNYSLVSFGHAMGAPLWGWIAAGVVCMVALFDLFRTPKSLSSVWIRVTVLSLVLSPLCWLNYLVLAIPPLLVVFVDVLRRSGRSFGVIALAASILFWPSALETGSHAIDVIVSHMPLFGMLMLYVMGRGVRERVGVSPDCSQVDME